LSNAHENKRSTSQRRNASIAIGGLEQGGDSRGQQVQVVVEENITGRGLNGRSRNVRDGRIVKVVPVLALTRKTEKRKGKGREE
jgi:hypothetical protein